LVARISADLQTDPAAGHQGRLGPIVGPARRFYEEKAKPQYLLCFGGMKNFAGRNADYAHSDPWFRTLNGGESPCRAKQHPETGGRGHQARTILRVHLCWGDRLKIFRAAQKDPNFKTIPVFCRTPRRAGPKKGGLSIFVNTKCQHTDMSDPAVPTP